MKRIFTVLLFLLSLNAYAATTATEHTSADGLVSSYVLGGTGDYVGYVVTEFVGACSVLVQTSVTDATTSIEEMGNWCDSESLYTPTRLTEPLVFELEDIRILGGTSLGNALSNTNEQLAFLGVWYELALFPQAKIVAQAAATNGLNVNQQKIALGYFIHGYGVPYTDAALVATNFVDSGIKAKYTELGLSIVPNPARVLLKKLHKIAGAYFN